MASGIAASIAGCAKQSPVLAESREIRLTQGDYNTTPFYSPDGRLIAYTTVREEGQLQCRVHVIPALGGEARVIRSDSSRVFTMGWAADGHSLYVMVEGDYSLRRMNLSGEFLEKFDRPNMSRFLAVSRDGARALYSIFNGDNWDLGVMSLGPERETHVIAETPTWEFDGSFGPGPEEVTAVGHETFGASDSKFTVWPVTGGEPREIPVTEGQNRKPAWSPDGRYVAYCSNQEGNADLWILDAGTGRSLQITSGPDEDCRPAWSPDGEWLTYVRGRHTSNLYVGDLATMETRRITEGDDVDHDPVPDETATRAAFFRYERASQEWSLCTAVLADGSVRELELKGLRVNASAGISWSPDGEQIAFAADDGSGNIDIYRTPREGGSYSRVTVTPGPDLIPSWSPDGKTIAYTRAAGGETQVWSIPATGGIPTQITFGENLSEVACWSSDSQRIAYLSVLGEKGYEIRVTTLSEPGSSQLVYAGEKVFIPTEWADDDRTVLAFTMEGRGAVWRFAVDGSEAVPLAEAPEEKVWNGFYFEVNAEGERYRDLIYPGGVQIYTDGDRVADIYALRVSELLQSGLTADLGRGGD